MWPEEATAVLESGRSLTELRSVGPFTAHFIAEWLRVSPDPPTPPPLRDGFITYAYARTVVDAHPEWRAVARADHQMHTDETDGSSTIEEMAEAAASIGRERIAITDHSKTLRITNGMDEARLVAQGEHIAAVNARGTGPVEIDAYPDRQDLDVERLRIVAAEGAWISIGTDAHTPAELVFLEIGIAAAILAGVSRDRILNLLSAPELAERVGLIRATKKREIRGGGSIWQGASASASTQRQARPADPALSVARPEVDSAPDRPAPAEASLKTSESKPRTRRRKG